jgi:hypothetical protein
LILRGGYEEQVVLPRVSATHLFYYTHRPGQISRIAFGPRNYHRIVHVKPNTWTLFFAGRRSRDWGFLVDGRHVPCRTYLGLPPEHDFGD